MARYSRNPMSPKSAIVICTALWIEAIFFVLQDMCALSSSHHWPMLSMSEPWGWGNSLVWLHCLADVNAKSDDFYKDAQKTLKSWDLCFFLRFMFLFKGKFWDWDILVGLILNDCVASGSLQQRTWRWDKRPMHPFDGITLALKQWMV